MINIIVMGLLLSPLILIILFIICALKLSSMNSRLEELERINNKLKQN